MANVGVSWVLLYHGRQANLCCTQSNAEGFYNSFSGQAFNNGDDLAWDEHFQFRSLGAGAQLKLVESVEMVYFSGHGDNRGPIFGIADRDTGRASPDDMSLGTGRLDFAIFDCCELLRAETFCGRWTSVFNGLHYILGFHTEASDQRFRGSYFAGYLKAGLKIRDAWERACVETEVNTVEWALLRAIGQQADTVDDHWHGFGSVSADPSPPVSFVYERSSC